MPSFKGGRLYEDSPFFKPHMLQVERISSRMAILGMTPAMLAQNCGVEPSLVASWLQPEVEPQAAHLIKLAVALSLTYEELLAPIGSPGPDLLFHGPFEPTDKALGHISECAMLLGALPAKPPFKALALDEAPAQGVEWLASHIALNARASLGLAESKPLHLHHLAKLLAETGVTLVPTPGRGGTVALPAAFTVRAKDECSRYVVVNIAAAPANVVRALALAYAQLFSGPGLEGPALERFAARLVGELVPLVEVKFPTVLHLLCADDPTPENYISRAEAVFNTPIFKMLQDWQDAEGCRNPTFVSRALCMVLQDAVGVTGALWAHRHPRKEP